MKIKIDGNDMEFAANAATPIRFKQVFHGDLMRIAQDTEHADYYEMVTQLAYILNRQGEQKGFSDASVEDYCEWLEGFSPMAFVEVADEIVSVWTDSQKGTSKAKK